MSPSFPIRRAGPGDLGALVALEESTFDHDRISQAQWRRHLRSGSACVLVAEEAGEILGCALLFFRRGARGARLYSIAVAPDARGRGLGAILLDAAEREASMRGCDSMRLEVRIDNARAIALYERCGYLRGGRVPRFYENGTDAWSYRKPLALATGAK
jgi:ribosomal protein S18 acetylase RimI-like enzyme